MKNRLNPALSDHGFTLIEVLIALAVLTIGVLSVNAMQTASIRGNATASRITTATTVGTDVVERFFSLPYNAATNGKDDDGDGLNDEPDEDVFNPAHAEGANPPGEYTLAFFAANGVDDNGDGVPDDAAEGDPDGYTISWTVQDNVPVSNSRTLAVSVTYTGPAGPRTISFNCVKVSKT